jgi:hypothetical protein
MGHEASGTVSQYCHKYFCWYYCYIGMYLYLVVEISLKLLVICRLSYSTSPCSSNSLGSGEEVAAAIVIDFITGH